jgi:hypothetical protein
MKSFLQIVLITVALSSFLFTAESRATHITGAELQYECIGKDSFLVTLVLFRDCDGINIQGDEPLTATNSCGAVINFDVDTVGSTIYEVSDVCTRRLPPVVLPGQGTTCNGGPLYGIQIYFYQAILDLSAFPSCAGIVQATGSGGSGSFTFKWPMFQTGNQMEDMCAGNYRVTVTDINGCEAENSISLTDPSTLRLFRASRRFHAIINAMAPFQSLQLAELRRSATIGKMDSSVLCAVTSVRGFIL